MHQNNQSNHSNLGKAAKGLQSQHDKSQAGKGVDASKVQAAADRAGNAKASAQSDAAKR